MTQELVDLIVNTGEKFFQGNKSTWSHSELQEIYLVYNAITGQHKQDSGCSSCRREVIRHVRDQYVTIKRLMSPPNK